MKRNLIISGLIATAVTLFGAAGVSTGELDLPGLNQRIDNIDARTTNNEQDITKLQDATQIAPAEHVDVPIVQATPAPAAAAPIQPAAAELAAATPAPTPAPTCVPAPVVSPAPGTSIVVIGPHCVEGE